MSELLVNYKRHICLFSLFSRIPLKEKKKLMYRCFDMVRITVCSWNLRHDLHMYLTVIFWNQSTTLSRVNWFLISEPEVMLPCKVYEQYFEI